MGNIGVSVKTLLGNSSHVMSIVISTEQDSQ